MPLFINTFIIYIMPTGVKLRLEKIQRDFLWGGGNLDEEDSFSELGYGLQKQRKGWAGSKKTGKSKQITAW